MWAERALMRRMVSAIHPAVSFTIGLGAFSLHMVVRMVCAPMVRVLPVKSRGAPLAMATTSAVLGLAACHAASTGKWVCSALLVVALVCAVVATQQHENEPTSPAQLQSYVNSSFLTRALARSIRTPEDAVFVWPVLRAMILTAPYVVAGLALRISVPCALLYLVGLLRSADELETFLHYDAHARAFAPRAGAGIVTRGILQTARACSAAVFGVPLARAPQWYESQHLGVHHAENNGKDDTQTTMTYSAASVADFVRYCGAFVMSGLFSVDICSYLWKKKRSRLLKRLTVGLLFYYTAIVLLGLIQPAVACLLLIGRALILSNYAVIAMSEHGLCDASAAHPASHACTWISEGFGSYGDDYHAEHHAHPGVHWTALAESFRRNAARYGPLDTLLIEWPRDRLCLLTMLWAGDWQALSCGMKLVDGTAPPPELIRRRAVRARRAPGPFDVVIGRVLGWACSGGQRRNASTSQTVNA
jgi:fatty acid desaturase